MSQNSPHIIVTEVPPGFLMRRNVRNHFSNYGTIVRLSMQSSYCILTFENHDQAKNAVLNGTLWKGMPLKIDFTPNHDPFGSDDAIINEELNWFAEDPGAAEKVEIRPPKSKVELRSSDAPPKKVGKIEWSGEEDVHMPNQKDKPLSRSLQAIKKSKEKKSATKRFLEDINARIRPADEAASTSRFSEESEYSEQRYSLRSKNKSNLPDYKSKISEDSRSLLKSREERRERDLSLDDRFKSEGKSVRKSSSEKVKRDSSPKMEYAGKEGKSVLKLFKSKGSRRDRESSPLVSDSSKSVLKMVEEKRREREPTPMIVDLTQDDSRSSHVPLEEKKKKRESSPMFVGRSSVEGKSPLVNPEDKKSNDRASLPLVTEFMKSENKSFLRTSLEKKRERDSSPMELDESKPQSKYMSKTATSELKKRDQSRDKESSPVDASKAGESKHSSKFVDLLYQLQEPSKSPKTTDENKVSLKLSDSALFSKQTITLKDKLDTLEERDRLIRLKLDIDRMESVMQGTCPDMCPEKERILREVRNMVSPYEALPDGRMDHRKAVKEYTRSSADQGKPLPHELRPEPVLTMTMSYLIDCIISRIDDGVEENLHNWYDFCWGRLRAIRKDIIQQDLCDTNTVMILEQCARFHIACYDRLWGMSKSLFDDKLNTETLNNCLAALMNCYKDLRQDNVFCENEAEFNAYHILLNMNNGGFLVSEYQKFNQDLKKSPLIKEAVKIHLAYHNNMFSTYFKFTKNTSYLNACLAQRFFQHVRTEALNTIVKSHCISNKLSNISVRFLMNTLKLDSINDCVDLCESTGLTYFEDEECFKTYRNDFYISEFIYKVETPSSLVLNKRVPIAKAVVGKNRMLPIYLNHTVHESFNSDGMLKESSIDAADQEEKMLRDNVERKLMISQSKITFGESSPRKDPEISKSASTCLEPAKQLEPMDEVLTEENKTSPKGAVPVKEIDETDTVINLNNLEKPRVDSNIFSEVDKTCSSFDQNKLSFPLSSSSSQITAFQFSSAFQLGTLKSPESGLRLNELKSSDVLKSGFSFTAFRETPESKPQGKNEQLTHTESNETIPEPEVELAEKYSFKIDSYSSKESPWVVSAQEHTLSHEKSVGSNTLKGRSHSKNLSSKMSQPISQSHEAEKEKTISEQHQSPKTIKQFKKSKKEYINYDKLRRTLSENMKKVSARKYLRVWKEKASKLRSSKELEAMVLHNLSPGDCNKLWGRHSRKRPLYLSRRLLAQNTVYGIVIRILNTSLSSYNSMKYLRDSGEHVINALREVSHKKSSIDFNGGPIAVFWKLVFALPPPPEGGTMFGTKLRDWCRALFYVNKDLSHAELHIAEPNAPVAIKVEVIEGLEDFETCANLCALVVIRCRGWETTDETASRIEKLVSLSNIQIPVAVLNLGNYLDSVNIINNPKINYYKQCIWENSKTAIDVLCELASNVGLLNIVVKNFYCLVQMCYEKLFDSLSQDSFLHDGLAIALSDPNKIIFIYNQLIDKIYEEIRICKAENYFGTAYEFKNDLEQYQPIFHWPDKYGDNDYVEFLNLRCRKCKLRPLKLKFMDKTNFLTFFQNYCDDLGFNENIFKTLMRYLKLPYECSGAELTDHLQSVRWLPFFEILIKGVISVGPLAFNVVFRNNEINKILESRYWFESGII